ncbi:MAG: hypothetical protein HXL32_10705 [Prevotellaceae bacterium]|nr:hypothetical protein [Prevotellaceae bacterium]
MALICSVLLTVELPGLRPQGRGLMMYRRGLAAVISIADGRRMTGVTAVSSTGDDRRTMSITA